jgi:hypothetical protein
MTALSTVSGLRQTHKLRGIASASYTTLVPAPNKLWTLDSVHFANYHSGAVGVTLEIYDGSAATVLLPEKSVDTEDTYTFKDHNITLGANEILRVKAATASVVDVTAVGFEGMATG